jgi:hypothetical protein
MELMKQIRRKLKEYRKVDPVYRTKYSFNLA